MKLNDIFTDLPEKLDLTKDKKKVKLDTVSFLSEKNLENISPKKLKTLDLKDDVKLKTSKNKTKIFDSVCKRGKVSKTLNLKKTITNSRSIFRRILGGKAYAKLNIKTQLLKEKKLIFKIFMYIGVLLLIILTDKLYIEHLVRGGLTNLENIKTSQSYGEIKNNIKDAKVKLSVAKVLFYPFSLIPNYKIQNANKAINIGKDSASLLSRIAGTYEEIKNELKGKNLDEIYPSELILERKDLLLSLEKDIKNINTNLYKIKLNINDPYNEKIDKAKSISSNILESIDYVNNNLNSLLALFGQKKPKKYLIVFQNNDELRPTGGFMGSAGVLNIFRGQVKDFNKKDIYAFEWDIDKSYVDKIKAPKGIDKVSTDFNLRDSNFYIDFNHSASSINFFMQKGGYNMDGIIFINMNPILKILDKTGGIYFEKIDKTITSENFSEIMSILVEAKSYKAGTLGTPKQILFDFMEVLKEKILSEGNIASYAKIIFDEVKNREVVVTNFDKNENDLLLKLGLNGKIDYGETLDFAYPVFTSIGGNKTDRYIERSYSKNIKINNDCSINTDLKINIKHKYNSEIKNRINNYLSEYNIEKTDKLLNIQGAGINKTFIRILLPKEAKIDPNIGANIKYFENSSYVDFYSNTTPGMTSVFDIKYKLKNEGCSDYNFKLYKQSGIKSYDINIKEKSGENNYKNIENDFTYKINPN